MPYNIKEPKDKKGNHWSIGDIGENWVKYKLSQKTIDSIIIDRTYDLFAWQRMHRIEVKASKLSDNLTNSGSFNFHFHYWQTVEDAFDYVICCCLNDKNEVEDYYVIPQKYIHTYARKIRPRKNKGMHLSILKDNNCQFVIEGNSYNKFTPCRNLDFDMFLQSNKSAFTRKKNALTKQLLDYNTNHRNAFIKAVKEIYKDDDIEHPAKTIKEQYGCHYDTITRLRKELGIAPSRQGKGKTWYTCKKCGYTTHNKQNYERHLNRKKPCGGKKK